MQLKRIGCAKLVIRSVSNKTRCKCSHCQRAVSLEAKKCRHCGADFIVNSIVDTKSDLKT